MCMNPKVTMLNNYNIDVVFFPLFHFGAICLPAFEVQAGLRVDLWGSAFRVQGSGRYGVGCEEMFRAHYHQCVACLGFGA